MSGLKLFGFVLAFALPLSAQKNQLNERQLGAYKGREDAVRAGMNYCDAVDDSAQQQQPRIFAELPLDSTTKSKSHDWKEFARKDEWEAAGEPAPVAFVWDRGGAIVRVTVVASPPRHRIRAGAYQRIDYCYGPDTKVVRIRAVWYVPTYCEFLFPCRLISDHDFFLLGDPHPAVTDWVFTANGAIQKLRNGKAVDDYFDPSYSLSVSDLHLRTSDDLPFSKPGPQ
jgi:hypothetical protein